MLLKSLSFSSSSANPLVAVLGWLSFSSLLFSLFTTHTTGGFGTTPTTRMRKIVPLHRTTSTNPTPSSGLTAATVSQHEKLVDSSTHSSFTSAASLSTLGHEHDTSSNSSGIATTITATAAATTTTAPWLSPFTMKGGGPKSDHYDWNRSTEENYQSQDRISYGKFRHIRERLDYHFHEYYTKDRQELQDEIIEFLLNLHGKLNPSCYTSRHRKRPKWVILTAGVMGAGKSYTIHRLHEQGIFPLESFVVVDPDEIRRLLPEFQGYIRQNAENAGALTRKEAGMMAEILSEAALERGQNVLKDGSLRDADWYRSYFENLRQVFPDIRLGIIHVTAPLPVIQERVQKRAKLTGRIVPLQVLKTAAEQVPTSVRILKNFVDFFVEIDNSGKEKDGLPGAATSSGVQSIAALKEQFSCR